MDSTVGDGLVGVGGQTFSGLPVQFFCESPLNPPPLGFAWGCTQRSILYRNKPFAGRNWV